MSHVACKWVPKAINKKVTYLHSLLSCVNLFRWGWGHLEATIMRGLSTSIHESTHVD